MIMDLSKLGEENKSDPHNTPPTPSPPKKKKYPLIKDPQLISYYHVLLFFETDDWTFKTKWIFSSFWYNFMY